MPRAGNISPFPVDRIQAGAVENYLGTGTRLTRRGISMYAKPTPVLEVGFLIRKSAGNAVHRNQTRRLFWGLVNNHMIPFPNQGGFLFLFHRSFQQSVDLAAALAQLVGKAA